MALKEYKILEADTRESVIALLGVWNRHTSDGVWVPAGEMRCYDGRWSMVVRKDDDD